MAHEVVNGVCENKCLVEVLPKELAQKKIKYGYTEPTVDQLEDGDVYFLLEDE